MGYNHPREPMIFYSAEAFAEWVARTFTSRRHYRKWLRVWGRPIVRVPAGRSR